MIGQLCRAFHRWIAEPAHPEETSGGERPAARQANPDDEPTQPAAPRARRSTNPFELFLRNVPGQLDQIALAVAAGDCAVVRVRTHKLKGSCAAIGVQSMVTLCAKLELCPVNQRELVEQLRSTFLLVRADLLVALRASRRLTS